MTSCWYAYYNVNEASRLIYGSFIQSLVLITFFHSLEGSFLRLWDYLFLMILPLGIGPRVPNFNCILKQMLTSNETELRCLMETTWLKENKSRENWLTDLSRQPFGFIKNLNYSLHWNTVTVSMLLSECVWRESMQMNIFFELIYFERWLKIHLKHICELQWLLRVIWTI